MFGVVAELDIGEANGPSQNHIRQVVESATLPELRDMPFQYLKSYAALEKILLPKLFNKTRLIQEITEYLKSVPSRPRADPVRQAKSDPARYSANQRNPSMPMFGRSRQSALRRNSHNLPKPSPKTRIHSLAKQNNRLNQKLNQQTQRIEEMVRSTQLLLTTISEHESKITSQQIIIQNLEKKQLPKSLTDPDLLKSYSLDDLEKEGALLSQFQVDVRQAKEKVQDAINVKKVEAEVIEQNTCSICFEHPRTVAIIPCGHVFCKTCVHQLQPCPLCRTKRVGWLPLHL